MHHLFFVNQVSGLVDQGHQVIEIMGPIIEDIGGILLLDEINSAFQTIDLGSNGAVDD